MAKYNHQSMSRINRGKPLLVIYIFLLTAITGHAQSMPAADTSAHVKRETDTDKNKFDSSKRGLRVVKSGDTKNRPIFWKDPKNDISLAISVFALGYAYYVYRKVRWTNPDFLNGIEKLFVGQPYLKGIYDMHKDEYAKQPNGMAAVELHQCLEAFCYYHLNNFETVYLCLNPLFKIKHGKKVDPRKTWQDNLIRLLLGSTLFREIVEKESVRNRYNFAFLVQIREMLKLAEELSPIYERYKSGKINKMKYIAELRVGVDEADKMETTSFYN
jgi:hypothetical protein